MYRKVAVVSIIVLLMSLAFASVSFAQSGTAANTNNTQNQSNDNRGQGLGPDNAFRALAPGGMRNLRANEQQWYAFEYAGDNSPIQIRLTGSNVQFSVWTQQDIANAGGSFGASANPTGRSTSNDQFGGDQFWQGQFNTPGTYYIMVENANGGQGGSYTLSVTGTGVSWKGQGNNAVSNNNSSSSNNQSSSTSSQTGTTGTTSSQTGTTGTTSSRSGSTGSTAGATPRTLPRTGGEMASVLPMLIGGMGALSVTAGALLRRRK